MTRDSTLTLHSTTVQYLVPTSYSYSYNSYNRLLRSEGHLAGKKEILNLDLLYVQCV